MLPHSHPRGYAGQTATSPPAAEGASMYGAGILKGMLVTLKHIARPPFTVQYPEEVRPMPARARTNLVWFEERCTGSSTCAQACPDGCILVATSPAEGGGLHSD